MTVTFCNFIILEVVWVINWPNSGEHQTNLLSRHQLFVLSRRRSNLPSFPDRIPPSETPVTPSPDIHNSDQRRDHPHSDCSRRHASNFNCFDRETPSTEELVSSPTFSQPRLHTISFHVCFNSNNPTTTPNIHHSSLT